MFLLFFKDIPVQFWYWVYNSMNHSSLKQLTIDLFKKLFSFKILFLNYLLKPYQNVNCKWKPYWKSTPSILKLLSISKIWRLNLSVKWTKELCILQSKVHFFSAIKLSFFNKRPVINSLLHIFEESPRMSSSSVKFWSQGQCFYWRTYVCFFVKLKTIS